MALRLLPARYRGHLAAVYGFARAVDDMGDEAPPGSGCGLLNELEADLARLYRSLPGPALAGQAHASGNRPGPAAGPQIGVVRALAPAVASARSPSSRSAT